MGTLHNILGLSYYPLRLKNSLRKFFLDETAYQLRVLSYHDISKIDERRFRRHLLWLKKTWKFLTPQEFAQVINGQEQITQDSLLLTFDDGTISNLKIAETVLDELNIKALFFIVSEYALITDEPSWRTFAAKKIQLIDDPYSLPFHFRNMSILDLRKLISYGHEIGAHTATHANLATLTKKDLNAEIVLGADMLEEHLDIKIQHFAYPFGAFNNISKEALQIASKRFNYVYSGMRGNNTITRTPWHISRESNHPHDTLWFTGACLEGAADFIYTNFHKICRDWSRRD
jgi:peptidoglycan/xylan/chitin deacetylase (PgdA/CDA1 family)